MSFKSGFVTIIGNPNVGKSSLFNAILNFELSVVTHKSQTTRDSIKGILTTDNFQLVLSDTPGHVESSYLLHDKMNKNIYSSLEGSDSHSSLEFLNKSFNHDVDTFYFSVQKCFGLPSETDLKVPLSFSITRRFNMFQIKFDFRSNINKFMIFYIMSIFR